MKNILELLAENSKLTTEEIASMLDTDSADIAKTIHDYEEHKVILGYKTIVDWEKTDRQLVQALIEIKITPQEHGFDRVSQRISQYDEVESLFLLSGGFDLLAMVSGRTLNEVALFVAGKLAPLREVTSTATHFVLHKYKDNFVLFEGDSPDQERLTIL
ncbi:MAG: Lrp/AsnC family transcriptional regulator [Clostridia bacterium]